MSAVPAVARRGSRAATVLVVAEVVVAVALCVAAGVEILTTPGWSTPLALVLAAAITLPTGAYSFRPEVAAAIVLGASVVQSLLSTTPGSVAELLALIVTVTQGAIRIERHRVAFGVAALFTCAVVVLRSEGPLELTDAVFYLLVLLGPPLAGLLVRSRVAAVRSAREREQWIRAQRRTLAELAVREERARIARELHDIVAHALSAAVVQAVGGRAVMARDPQAAAAAFEVIAATADRAVGELQRLLGALHEAATVPAPSLEGIAGLVDEAARSGLPVTLATRGAAQPLTADVELAGYRIVQEALTNAVRYAGAAHTDVEIEWSRALTLRVSSGPSTSRTSSVGSGHGIVGMRERAALCGGRLTAGPTPTGGFCVEVELPAARP